MNKKLKSSYWRDRSRMVYYSNVDLMVRRVGRNAKSLLDVGSRSAQYIEEYEWIPKRCTLDIVKPYSSSHIEGIQMDFFKYQPSEKFDLVLCLQVLEHIHDAPRFAQKLLATGRRLIVSVPYMWPESATRHHVQDPVSKEKLSKWFEREPDYSIVVQEPLWTPVTGRRLISYFHDDPSTFDIDQFRRKA